MLAASSRHASPQGLVQDEHENSKRGYRERGPQRNPRGFRRLDVGLEGYASLAAIAFHVHVDLPRSRGTGAGNEGHPAVGTRAGLRGDELAVHGADLEGVGVVECHGESQAAPPALGWARTYYY